MALKATIHKATVQVSDLDRNLYTDHSLTLARHPSETDERMVMRLLAYVLNAPPNNDLGTLDFGKDMWDPDEPCLWQIDHTGLIEHWIDIGQPDEKRVAKACGRAKRVTIYSFSGATASWWSSVSAKLSRFDRLTVWQLPPDQAEQLGTLADRSMEIQITLQEGNLWVEGNGKSVELTLIQLHPAP